MNASQISSEVIEMCDETPGEVLHRRPGDAAWNGAAGVSLAAVGLDRGETHGPGLD
jgi:hypothetical protein